LFYILTFIWGNASVGMPPPIWTRRCFTFAYEPLWMTLNWQRNRFADLYSRRILNSSNSFHKQTVTLSKAELFKMVLIFPQKVKFSTVFTYYNFDLAHHFWSRNVSWTHFSRCFLYWLNIAKYALSRWTFVFPWESVLLLQNK